MSQSDKREIILSFETINGGIGLLVDREPVRFWYPAPGGFRGEDFLRQTWELLKAENLKIGSIRHLVVSEAEGSLTGGKIASAAVKGLSKALGCRVSEVSVLRAMLCEVTNAPDGYYTTGVAVGKSFVKYQRFIKTGKLFAPDNFVVKCHLNEFMNLVGNRHENESKFIFAENLRQLCESGLDSQSSSRIIWCEAKMANLVARFFLENGSDNVRANKKNTD